MLSSRNVFNLGESGSWLSQPLGDSDTNDYGKSIIKILQNLVFGKQTEGLLLQLVDPSDLCVEMVEQLCVPRTWLIHLLGYVVDVVCSVVKHLGDDEGAFPGRIELVRPFPIHSEHKVSFVERSTSNITGMESTQILLIDGRPD